MKKLENYDNIREFNGINPGAYIVQIKSVVDKPDKEYLEIQFDIVKHPEYAGYFTDYYKENGTWSNSGIYRASYKETASKFFKRFITAIEKSNSNFIWDWNEHKLIGKLFVAVFGEEEFLNQDGDLRVSCKVREVRSIEALEKGIIKIPERKVLKHETSSVDVILDTKDLPF